jgi:hypothetical protein
MSLKPKPMIADLIDEESLLAGLHCSRRFLRQAIESRRIFFVELDGTRLYPAFYADPCYDRKQLWAVTKRLGELPDGSKLQFFQTPKGSLGGLTPLQALRLGQAAAVNIAAEGFGSR